MANALTLVIPLAPDADLGKLQAQLGARAPGMDALLAQVGTVHFARFMLFQHSAANLRPDGGDGPFSLAVITSYDGDFGVYVQDFVNEVGDVFDALLSFSADGQSLVPVAKHVDAFTAYVAANNLSQQPPNDAIGLHSGYQAPYTVQQINAAGIEAT